MKKIKHLMIWIGLLLSLVSCKDTMEAIGLGGDEIPAEGLVLNLQLTNFTKQQIGTRAGSSETVKSLWAVFYGDNNEYKGKTDCYSTLSPRQPDGSYKVKITNVPAGTKNVHLVANASDIKVALYKDAKEKIQYALLRNHHYTIKVTKVNDYGFSTLEEAKKSLPENRVEVEVVDDNPEITQMIACKDYELGVSDYQEVDASTTKAIVTIVTTLPDATSSDDWLYSVQKNASWITACDQETVNDTPETGRKSSKGKKYTLKLTLTKNDQSEEPRIGTITVTHGDLSLDITIKQAGFDFRRKDPDRIVTMQYNNSTVAANYFNWLDTGVQGITPEEMQGAVRNDGLHFCVGTADITYLIPKLDGDQITKKDDKIKVEEENGKWKVSLTNTTANKNLWKASFTIKNQAGIEITYPVYHTGIFHKIDETSKVYNDYQLTENGDNEKKVKGWFYYGVVKVEGKKADETTTTYIPIIVIIHFIVYCRRVPLFY